MNKITPCLFFDGNGEEAARFYTSVFKNSKIKLVTHYGEHASKASGQKKGSVMTVVFEIEGQEFMALNGGPSFKFTPAISLMVNCKTQAELDEYWKKLSADPSFEQCSWLKDKFGVSWQIVPASLSEMMKDDESTDRVMKEVVKMKKLDIATLERAAAGQDAAASRK